ncbi:MAG: TolC family protein [bacterium]
MASFTRKVRCSAALVLILELGAAVPCLAQKRKPKPAATKPTAPVNEIAKLQEEFIKATKEYKANLARLSALYERNVTRTEERLTQAQVLFKEGLISKNQLTESELAVAAAKDKVSETVRQMANADTQIADTLVEAEAEAQLAKNPIRKGTLVNTTSYIRFSGAGTWMLSDAWKVQRFFLDSFKKQLPVAVFGQGSIHDRWRLDHRNAMDVSLHPDGPEGQALMSYLRSNGIPFLAFRGAIPGTATGPHIHIGRPSHRF